MPLPLIPIVTALASGGSLVPHAAGGMIVSGASGYVAGTYLSTSAIATLLGAASATLGAGALYFSGALASIIGGAGIFGTTVGATGLTGFLMSIGFIAATPIWVPIAIGCAALLLFYGFWRLFKLRLKVRYTPEGEEAQFSEAEAMVIEKLIRKISKKRPSEIA